MPISPAYLNLEKFAAKSNTNPRYESTNQNVGYCDKTGWCEYDLVVENSGSYQLRMGIDRMLDGAKMRVIITDVFTCAEEVNTLLEIPDLKNYEPATFSLGNLSAGHKKVRLEFVYEGASSEQWLYNFNHLSFVDACASCFTVTF